MLNPDRDIFLIGGAPTTGKSTLAEALSRYLGLPWLSTDQIRDLLRFAANRQEWPSLFNPAGYTVERFLAEFSSEEIVNVELAQGEAVWPAVKMLIEKDYTWENGFVVEGVNLLPHLVARDFKNNPHVRLVFLVDENPAGLRQVVFKRGLAADARAYSDDLKEKEVEWALLFSRRLKTAAEQVGYPWLQVQRTSDDLPALLAALELK